MIGMLVDKCVQGLERLFWPSTCVLCGQEGEPGFDLCRPCEADLPANSLACAICAQPLTGEGAATAICGACLQHPPPFQASFAPFRYAYPVDRLIQGLKFRRELAYGRVLGELFAQRLMRERTGPMPGLIVPVPLAPRRYRERGYNQASELARPIHRATGVPVRADVVVRRRETLEQAALDRKERRKNVRRAFALVSALPTHHVAILDDVVTTGSTVSELAKVLRLAGATQIEVWAIARAGK